MTEIDPSIFLHERLPKIEVPSIEVLDSLPSGHSALFPPQVPYHTPREMRGYDKGERPKPGSELYELGINLEAANVRNRHNDDENARRIRAAAGIQKRLVHTIHTAYQNVKYADFPHPPDTYMIDQYIEDQDAKMFHLYAMSIAHEKKLLDGLSAGDDSIHIPGSTVHMAIASPEERHRELGKVERAQPVSTELQREAYRHKLDTHMQKTYLRMDRLKFEWISARVIVEFLRDSIDSPPSSDELALAS